MNDDMTTRNWSNPEYLATLAAEELSSAMDEVGIDYVGCYGDQDGDVNVSFASLADAGTLLTLGVRSDETPGSLYDRATSSCVTITSLAATGEELSDDQLESAIDAGWVWVIHPNMQGKRIGWHARVDLPSSDAMTLAANLNAHRGGAV